MKGNNSLAVVTLKRRGRLQIWWNVGVDNEISSIMGSL